MFQNKVNIIYTHVCTGQLNNVKKIQIQPFIIYKIQQFMKTFVLKCLQRTETAGTLSQKCNCFSVFFPLHL